MTEKESKMTEKESKMTEKELIASSNSYEIHIEEEILDAEHVATILNSSKKIVERELREGSMKGYKRLNKWFVLKSELVEYIRSAKKE
jgi:hypothetical protein